MGTLEGANMALTMTRKRTQTTLVRLVRLLANLNGELEFIQQLTQENPDDVEALLSRQKKLADGHAAVCATIKQFDPDVDCTLVASSNDWMRSIAAAAVVSKTNTYIAYRNELRSRGLFQRSQRNPPKAVICGRSIARAVLGPAASGPR
jgi:hypothetical protein